MISEIWRLPPKLTVYQKLDLVSKIGLIAITAICVSLIEEHWAAGLCTILYASVIKIPKNNILNFTCNILLVLLCLCILLYTHPSLHGIIIPNAMGIWSMGFITCKLNLGDRLIAHRLKGPKDYASKYEVPC